MTKGIRHYDWIRHHAHVGPDRPAMRDLVTGRALTYPQLNERTDRLARYLQDSGIKKGDRVALLAYNGTEYFELEFACGRVGAIAVLLNWRLTASELEYILNDSSPKLLIHDVSFAQTAEDLQSRCKIANRLVIDIADPASSYERALAGAKGKPDHVDLSHDDPITLMYSSGTTGHPKGVIITHGMAFWNCVNLGVPSGVTAKSVQLVSLPLFHTGALNVWALPILHAGGTILIQRMFDPAEALRLLGDRKEKITHFTGVPATYQAIAQQKDFATIDWSALEIAGIAGAPCPLPLLKVWADQGANIIQLYGMTETGPIISMLDSKDAARKIGSAGKPLLYTEIRVVDTNGQDVKQGEVGEFWIRGLNVTCGYWNNPQATASSFHDGWLKTGDAGRLDEEGFIYVVDRWKDMYISGGENVYPAEVENVLSQLPQIAEAAVIGVPNERWGEVGMAVVVLKPGTELDQHAVIAHCTSRLAKFKVPAQVSFVEALPRNAVGKILKRELRTTMIGAAPLIA